MRQIEKNRSKKTTNLKTIPDSKWTILLHVVNFCNGVLYLSIAVSMIVRDTVSDNIMLDFMPIIHLTRTAIIVMLIVSSIPWFIFPKRFILLSIAVIPLVSLTSTRTAYLLTTDSQPFWPVFIHYLYFIILGGLNFNYHSKRP